MDFKLLSDFFVKCYKVVFVKQKKKKVKPNWPGKSQIGKGNQKLCFVGLFLLQRYKLILAKMY